VKRWLQQNPDSVWAPYEAGVGTPSKFGMAEVGLRLAKRKPKPKRR
jgi:hypothetical protein